MPTTRVIRYRTKPEHADENERLVREVTRLGDLVGQIGRGGLGQRREEPQRTRVGHRRNQFRAAHPLHPTLHDGVLDPEHVREFRRQRHRARSPIAPPVDAALTSPDSGR